jgi:hypothetical protein
MIIYDKKKAVSTIMARRQHKDGSTTMAEMKPERSTSEDGQPDGRHAAMQDFMAAHKEGSAQKMMEAMANFIDLHRMASETAEDTTPEVPTQPESES